MKVRIYKAPDGKGKFVNKLGSFMQKASNGLQVANMRALRQEMIDMSDQGDDLETIADTITNNYGLNYDDVYDEVQTLLGFPQEAPSENNTPVTTDGQTTPTVETPIDYDLTSNTGEELADDMEEGWGDEQGSNEEMRRGGSTSKKTFVKGVMRTLKKAAEGMEQEDSNVADTTDLPYAGRKGFVNNWKQGVKNLGNEFYAKQMYDQAQNAQMMQPAMEPGLETASKGKEVRKAKSDFQKAFGDIAAGYFGVPGMPNYLQTINVVDPSKMPQGQMPNQQAQGEGMPGIDFQYKKGPWWSGQREWSAKGVPIGMMMGMPGGNMQGMPMQGTGYMPVNPWGYSYSGKRQVPGKIITETTTRLINRAADPANPTSENKGVLNNNPESNPISPNWLAETSIDPQVFNIIQNIKTNELEQRRRAAADFENTPEAADLSQDEYSSRLAGYGVRPYETTFDPYGLEDEARLDGEYEGALNNAGSVDWDLLTRAYGGAIDQSQMQPGVLAKFFTGGNDASPMVQYQDNDINTKNVDDPYGYAEGGLIKAEPGYTVTKSPNFVDNMIPEYTSPAHQQYAPGTTTAQNRAAFDEMVRRGVLDANTKYDPAKSYASIDKPVATNQGTTTQVNNQGYAPQFRGYPTAPTVREQIGRMFNPFHDKSGNFTWASQSGPAKMMNGMPFNPAMVGGPEGYVQDYQYNKSPWYKGGKQTLSVTNRYVGANGKPVAGATPAAENKPGVGIYAPGIGVNAAMKPAGATTTTGTTTEQPVANTDKYARRDERYNTRNDRRAERRGLNEDSGITPMSDEDYMAKVNANKAAANQKVPLDKFTSEREEMNPQPGFAFGGSALSRYIGGGINAGTGPFDPNKSTFDANTDVNQDECTDFEKRDPNSPCYNANANIPAFAQPGASLQSMMGMESKQQPQDYTVDYDLHNAKKIDTNALANDFKLASRVTQGVDNLNQNAYSKQYSLANIASSDSREPTNDLDYTGGYSGINQRHVGAPRFNSVVGEAAFVRYGGTPNYAEGGEYNMSQEELLKFMAQGGQVEFI